MERITGRYNEAVVYTDNIEEKAMEQIRSLCDLEVYKDSRIRIMPDVHAGAGCTIGTTMTLHGAVTPNLVGVDIGCGMEVVRIAEKEIDFAKLDALIRKEIPSGRNTRSKAHQNAYRTGIDDLLCREEIRSLESEYCSIGTLGGGNHFIEVDRDEEGNLYLVIHSGSRHLGKEVAEIYQRKAYQQLNGNTKEDIQTLIDSLKAQGREKEIEEAVQKRKKEIRTEVPKELAYCSGALYEDYIHDMKIMQEFADINRKTMMEILLAGMGLPEIERFTTVHNYIDTKKKILRKGSVSAEEGERLLIPINMKDGSLICIGKGNPEWNCSAPHGAGRLFSRSEAKKRYNVAEFAEAMKGIYTTSVSLSTLDECPMAYKSMEEIVANIKETARIERVIKPVYNFKAGE
ncbi:MAG: RtcB family protein [Erysipelotrichaceae bacterium]|nr:RtcB family protein [Erysipelotrichaceae bacterium]